MDVGLAFWHFGDRLAACVGELEWGWGCAIEALMGLHLSIAARLGDSDGKVDIAPI